MKNAKTNEVNLIRSRALTVLFSLAFAAIVLLPLSTSAKDCGRFLKKGKGQTEVVNNNEVVVPEFKAVGKRARVKLSNTNNLEYSFKIIGPIGEELYSSKDDKGTINKIFDFSNVSAGKYQIIVSSDNSDFAFDFENQK